MIVTPLIPDAPATSASARHDSAAFENVLNGLGSVFASANAAEDRFANGGADLQQAIYERARADVALAVATAAAQRTAQALQSVLSMQV
ncbi:MAG TPA: flagellar hook-basal body complex protein FliE [Candidatus Baltobacteraceae bacterium]|jgi:flagellar hook-basal body complex protein FliE|nr:flagellar hook-basal body complex protein FliE [Candidatus Baltobacteraceae bacterium]